MKKLYIYFTDTDFIFVEKNKGLTKLNDYGSVKLPSGYIKNGIIIKADELITFVEGVLERTTIKSKKVNLLLHEKIVDYKKFPLPENIKEKNIGKYIDSQLGEELILPFSDPIIDYRYTNMSGTTEAIIFAASAKVIASYVSLLNRVGLTVVDTDIPALATHRSFHITKGGVLPLEDEVMFVNVYDNLICINIFRRQFPFFKILSDSGIDFKKENYKEIIQSVQDEIYRMKNYYEWNINHGEVKINKAVVVPMTSDEELDNMLIKEIITDNMTGVGQLVFYNPKDENNLYDINVKYLLAMSSSLL